VDDNIAVDYFAVQKKKELHSNIVQKVETAVLCQVRFFINSCPSLGK
jgi:hypothetical protein